MTCFAVWWVLMKLTEAKRLASLYAASKLAHQLECNRIDEEYDEKCRPATEANKRLTAAWQSANAASAAEHQRSCKVVDEENRRLLATWHAAVAAIVAGHERACGVIDAANNKLVAAWRTENAAWLTEERKWRHRVAEVESEIKKLEAGLLDQRSASTRRFDQRKYEADGTLATHKQLRQEYDRDFREADASSRKIQLEEHLDRFLIRQAKLKAITTDRILSLESFGIETAKDVKLLESQKVPGIGPVLRDRLLMWREDMAKSFVPKQTLPASETNRLSSRYAPVMLPLGQSIRVTITELEAIIRAHRGREREIVSSIRERVESAAVAEAHLKALNRMA
jgi:hypothetical protein